MSVKNVHDASTAIHPETHDELRTVKRANKDDIVPDDATTLSDSELAREAALTALTVEEEKKLIRKVDWRLIPLLAMLYLVKKLDESNVSQARIMNKGTERNILTQLDVTSDQYGMVTVLYTVPYILAEIPSNLLLKRFKPSRWQSRIMLSWGIVTACTAAVHNLGGLYACRFLLGLTEAGMFPGIILQLSYWYRPDEIAVRLMWIFPGNTKWLSPVESAFLQARLPPNSPRSSEKNFAGSEIIASLKDKRLWLFTLSWALMTCGKNGIDFYRPSIIANMGFSHLPDSLAGTWSNKAKIPLPLFPIGCTVVIVAMYSILVVYPNDIGVYIGMMIGVACGTAWFPLMWPWRAQTVNGATGSAFAIGFVNSYGQVGDALGPQMFQEKYAPSYQLPFGLSMGLVGLCGIVNGVTWWVTRRTENDTRRHKRARILAKKNNEAVLDDVVDLDLGRKLRV
ncbi:putative tartrate transporter [Colletotrichum higginsianum]|uniref:Putative tartrate transporter n=1 Tax=Colletotrichum higginsianum TaxID=80884 RepID=A0A4T0VWX6_9PEZI|nr:putative tartrate transporter [Colletotrichum higginsianum]